MRALNVCSARCSGYISVLCKKRVLLLQDVKKLIQGNMRGGFVCSYQMVCRRLQIQISCTMWLVTRESVHASSNPKQQKRSKSCVFTWRKTVRHQARYISRIAFNRATSCTFTHGSVAYSQASCLSTLLYGHWHHHFLNSVGLKLLQTTSNTSMIVERKCTVQKQ